MAHLTLIRGLPGSGKSTIAKQYQALHLEADMFFIRDEKYDYHPHLINKAHSWCQNNVRHALSFGVDVVVSNTFIKAWELEKYAEIARTQKATFSIKEAKGGFDSLHGVPKEVICSMANNWEDVIIQNGVVLIRSSKKLRSIRDTH